MSNVAFIRQEVQSLLPVWFMIRDCMEGDTAIKGEYGLRTNYNQSGEVYSRRADKYLPRPNPTDQSEENLQRYKQYVERAVWYGFTSRTRDGLVGQIFLRPPISKVPDKLKVLETNADGDGLGTEQVAKRLSQSVMSYGRAGAWVDFPATQGALTVAEIATKFVQPTIKSFYPWQIVNWATRQDNARRVLSLVVLEEYSVDEDDFALTLTKQYRVLRLNKDNVYTVEVFEQIDPKSRATNPKFAISSQAVTPTGDDGKPFNEILFTFIGSEANDPMPDRPPMQDMAYLNIAHYRNSADYEESCFIAGQATPVIAGLTEQWVNNVLQGKVTLGSRGAVMLPAGAEMTLVQADPNSMPKDAMEMKQEQAIALGAKLVLSKKTVRTATEVLVDETSETSTLHNVAKNVSAAMETCIRWCCKFVGVPDTDVKYQLNTEFALTRMNANDRLAAVKMWQSGAIAWSEMRDVLRVDGSATLDDAEAVKEIAKEMAAPFQLGGAPIADPLQAAAPTSPGNDPANGGGAPGGAPKLPPAMPTPTSPKASK